MVELSAECRALREASSNQKREADSATEELERVKRQLRDAKSQLIMMEESAQEDLRVQRESDETREEVVKALQAEVLRLMNEVDEYRSREVSTTE